MQVTGDEIFKAGFWGLRKERVTFTDPNFSVTAQSKALKVSHQWSMAPFDKLLIFIMGAS